MSKPKGELGAWIEPPEQQCPYCLTAAPHFFIRFKKMGTHEFVVCKKCGGCYLDGELQERLA